MDLIRNGYRRQARISLDPRVPLVTLRWFKVPDDTPWFPHRHLFASMNWFSDDILVNPGIGEISLSRTWAPDEPPRPYAAKCFLGEKSWYVNGVPYDATISPPALPHCCVGPARAVGGARLGGWGLVAD